MENITTTSMTLTVCVIHNSIQSDSIKKPSILLQHQSYLLAVLLIKVFKVTDSILKIKSMVLTLCIQSDSITMIL